MRPLPKISPRRCLLKPPLRTKSVGTKVSEAEFALLEERARGAGMRLAEWVREALLASSVEMGTMAAERALLAKVLAMRTIHIIFVIRRSVKDRRHRLRQFPQDGVVPDDGSSVAKVIPPECLQALPVGARFACAIGSEQIDLDILEGRERPASTGQRCK